MNSIFEKHKWLKYVVGGFIVAIGILVIILAGVNPGSLPAIINIVIAASAMILGLFFLITSLFNESHKGFTPSLLLSAALLAGGITLLVIRFGSIGFAIPPLVIVYMLAILVLLFGCVSLVKGISLIVYKERVPLILLMFAAAVLGITLGILSLVFAKQLEVATFIILGIILVVFGILFIVFAALQDKKQK